MLKDGKDMASAVECSVTFTFFERHFASLKGLKTTSKLSVVPVLEPSVSMDKLS